MIIELAVVAGVGFLGYKVYQSYKRGTLLSNIATDAAELKAEVTALETKVKNGETVAYKDVAFLISNAKSVFIKLGL